MSKNRKAADGIVYSTASDFQIKPETDPEAETLAGKDQKLTIRLESKHRAGKAVSIVRGFTGKTDDLEDLSKKLKNSCGTGGSAKDGEIIIQGDHRQKLLQWLIKNGYPKTRII